VVVRLDPDVVADVDAMCKVMHMTRTGWIRKAVLRNLEHSRSQVVLVGHPQIQAVLASDDPSTELMEGSSLRITTSEQAELDWCRSILSDEELLACEEEAHQMAVPEMYREEAAARLVELMVDLKIRYAKERNEIENSND